MVSIWFHDQDESPSTFRILDFWAAGQRVNGRRVQLSDLGMYVCMVITYSRVWINEVRLPILLVVSWTGEIILPCPRVCLRIWSREAGSAVPSRVSLLISILRLNLVLTYGIPPEFRAGVHLWNRHTPSGQSRVCRVTQLRTDGVHFRESAGTGPVILKVVPNGCCLGRSPWTN